MIRLPSSVAVVAAGLALAGCGGEASDGEPTTGGAGSARTITISETDFALSPDTVRIDEPGTYTFEAVNDGQASHALEIEGQGVEEATETIGAGETAKLTVELSEAGEYELYCPVGNHREQGMEGTVVVGDAMGGTTTDDTTTGDDGGSGENGGMDY